MNTPSKDQLPAQTDTKGSASITNQQDKSSDNLLSKTEQANLIPKIDTSYTPRTTIQNLCKAPDSKESTPTSPTAAEQPASSATHQIDSVHTPGVISTYALEQDEQQSKPTDQQPDPIYSPRLPYEAFS